MLRLTFSTVKQSGSFVSAGISGMNVARRSYAHYTPSSRQTSFFKSTQPFDEARVRTVVNPELVLHCLFTQNNTILTLCRRSPPAQPSNPDELDQEYLISVMHPNQKPLISLNTGMLGFRGTKKGQYDAAYQVTSRMFELMKQRNLHTKHIEIVTRQFGDGRGAFINALLGKEGTEIRANVLRLTDGTRIKHGGDRAPNKRRV